jgi:hypothetical protein
MMIYEVEFKCPFCGSDSGINEEEWTIVANQVMTIEYYDERDVDFYYGQAEAGDRGCGEVSYVCRACAMEINGNIKSPADLYDWLSLRGMIREVQ